jgi:hypothetical protein
MNTRNLLNLRKWSMPSSTGCHSMTKPVLQAGRQAGWEQHQQHLLAWQ